MKTIVVVGGGITGLCTMHYLQRQVKAKGIDVNLLLIEKARQQQQQPLFYLPTYLNKEW